jgi:hypothetical protein
MSNFKLEEITGVRDAIRSAVIQALSAPRVEGKCQASIAKRNDGFWRLTCLECGHIVEGFVKTEAERMVEDWNDHIIYR